MKKVFVLLLGLLVLFAVSCSKREKAGEKMSAGDEKAAVALIELLPEQTEFLVKSEPLEQLYAHLAVTETSVLGEPVNDLETVTAKIGFNPLNLKELTAAGFDTGKPLALAVADVVIESQTGRPNLSMALLVPVTDGKKALDTIQAALKKNGQGISVTQDGALTVIQGTAAQDTIYLALKEKYLVAAANLKGDARPLIDGILAGKSSLAAAPVYKEITAQLEQAGVFVYANLARVAETNAAAVQQMTAANPALAGQADMLKEYRGVGLTVDLGSPNLNVKSLLTLSPEAATKQLWTGVTANKDAVLGVVDPAVFIVSLAANLSDYYSQNAAQAALAQMQAQIDGLHAASGIDMENEVIKNLGGSLNLGVYDGSMITISNYNTVLTLGVKDEAVTRGVLEKALKLLPAPQRALVSKQTIGDTEAYVAIAGITQVYLGIKNKQVILATSKALFEKALMGKVASGFASKLSDKNLAATLQGQDSVVYLNVREAQKTIKNFEMFLLGAVGGQAKYQKIQDAVSKFEYVLLASQFKEDALLNTLEIKTTFTQPFFVEAAHLAKTMTP